MHIVGAIRALASALDCLGSVIVGVVALPMPILTSGLRDALRGLKQLAPGAVPVQVDACARVDDAFRTAGPEGWQEWVQDYRNMLVHRGRRLQTAQLRPKGVEIHTPRGELIAPHAVVSVLPNAPSLSEVQAFLGAADEHPLLTESAWDTLREVITSTVFVTDSVGRCCESSGLYVARIRPS